jgi:hypothetical protein
LGDDPGWGFAIPWVYRALASPFTSEPILEAPRRGVDKFRGPLSYWASLLHLLVYRLGWVRRDRGMRWWCDSGKPITDPTFQLISEVWDADGQLDWFAAWLWSSKPWPGWNDAVYEATGYAFDQDALFEDFPLAPDDLWQQERKSEADGSRICAPVGQGGWDPLHLQSAHQRATLDCLWAAIACANSGRRQAGRSPAGLDDRLVPGSRH